MKNIVYLSLIAAVIFCSCKGNSYMTQRYTHFKHGAKKSASEAVVSKTPAKVKVNEAAVQIVAPQENTQQAFASADNVVAEQSAVKSQNSLKPNQFKLPRIKDISRVATFPSRQLERSNVKGKNAATTHHGLIFGLIDLALFIIIVAVVIALILLLVFVII